MRERWICKKCGTIFAERETTGPNDIIRYSRLMETDKVCPKCGGSVRWIGVDKNRDLPNLGGDLVSKVIACIFSTGLFTLLGAWIGYQKSGMAGAETLMFIGLFIGVVASVLFLFFQW